METFVRGQQRLQGLALDRRQMLAMRQQHRLLPFAVGPVGAMREALVLRLADLIHGVIALTQHVKLVVEHCGLWRVRHRRLPKRLPHIHDGEADAVTPLWAERFEEHRRAGLRAIHAAKPARSAQRKVTYNDAIDMAFANRDFVNRNDGGARLVGHRQLLAHRALVHLLHGVPVEALLLHAAAAMTIDAAQRKREIDAQVAAREIAHATRSTIIPRATRRAARPADRFLPVASG